MGFLRKVCAGLVGVLACGMAFAAESAFDGSWRGELKVGGTELPVVFNFSTSKKGKVSCTLDSPMQGVKGLAAKVSYCKNDSVALRVNVIGAAYNGKLTGDSIVGTFAQGGHQFPLVLKPELSLAQRRPQTPVAPFPYASVDTTFLSDDGTLLAGTVVIPDSIAKGAPMVVMISGSGAQNRDEEIFDHRPFAVIADFLARKGIGSLRYDDRGTARSKGHFQTADIDTFRMDARSALKFARSLGRFGKVGVLGHSEGGTIALQLATEKVPDFAVSLAGAFTSGKQLILAQNLRMLEKMNLGEKAQEDGMTLISMVFDDVIAGKPYDEIPIDAYVNDNGLEVPEFVTTSLKKNLKAADGSQYFRKLLSLEPAKGSKTVKPLKSVKIPVLALNGTLDTQVPAKDNLEVIRRNVKKAQVKEYPGLNHLFQHATTGEMTEYISIPETISPEVLSDIAAFILSLK